MLFVFKFFIFIRINWSNAWRIDQRGRFPHCMSLHISERNIFVAAIFEWEISHPKPWWSIFIGFAELFFNKLLYFHFLIIFVGKMIENNNYNIFEFNLLYQNFKELFNFENGKIFTECPKLNILIINRYF